MPSPPITIGELTDVPAFGSPIASPWAQEATRRIAHRFATTAARDAAYPANSAGVGAICTVGSVLYTSDGSMWQGPLGAGANLIGSPPSGAGGWTSVLWGAGSYAGGLITVDASGNITMVASLGPAVWLFSWSATGQTGAGNNVETRVVRTDNAGPGMIAPQPTCLTTLTNMGGTCHFRTPGGGSWLNVQTAHGTSRTISGGFWRLDRISL
jgi:hypothetical protein